MSLGRLPGIGLDHSFADVDARYRPALTNRGDGRDMVGTSREGIVRGLLLGACVGIVAALLWVIEFIRRDAERNRVDGHLWPRPDGSVRSFGEVWDHPSHPEGAAT